MEVRNTTDRCTERGRSRRKEESSNPKERKEELLAGNTATRARKKKT